MLDGLRLWLERGLEEPAAVRGATDEYRADSDPVGRFISECVEEAPGERVQAGEMYKAFVRWCEAGGERVWKRPSFGTALRERRLKREKVGCHWYVDVRLVNVPDADVDGPPPVEGEDDYD